MHHCRGHYAVRYVYALSFYTWSKEKISPLRTYKLKIQYFVQKLRANLIFRQIKFKYMKTIKIITLFFREH